MNELLVVVVKYLEKEKETITIRREVRGVGS